MNKLILNQEVENYISFQNYICINDKIKECYGISK